MNWNKWVRQIHRWLSATFVVVVALSFVAAGQTGLPDWVFFLPLFPLALLLLTGVYLFVLPYVTRWRGRQLSDDLT